MKRTISLILVAALLAVVFAYVSNKSICIYFQLDFNLNSFSIAVMILKIHSIKTIWLNTSHCMHHCTVNRFWCQKNHNWNCTLFSFQSNQCWILAWRSKDWPFVNKFIFIMISIAIIKFILIDYYYFDLYSHRNMSMIDLMDLWVLNFTLPKKNWI